MKHAGAFHMVAALSALACAFSVLVYVWHWSAISHELMTLTTAGIATAFIALHAGGKALGLVRSVPALFLIGLIACNLGFLFVDPGILLAQDALNSSLYFGSFDYEWLSTVVACASVNAYVCGASASILIARRRQPCMRPDNSDRKPDKIACLCMLALLVACYTAEAMRTGVIAAAYTKGEYTKALITLGQLAFSGLVIYAAYVRDDARHRLALACCGFALYFVTAAIGWRGFSIAFIAAALVVQSWSFTRLRKRYIILAYAVSGIIWATVGSERGKSLDSRSYLQAALRSFDLVSDTLLYPARLTTVQVVALRYGVKFAEEYGTGGGRWYAHYLTYLLPNVTADARGPVSSGESPCLAIRVSDTYVGRFGIGFTPVAEAYCNFGIAGAVLMLGMVGMLLQRVHAWVTEDPGPDRLVVYGMIAAGVFWWIRNDSMQLGRYVLWGIVLHVAFRSFLVVWPYHRKPRSYNWCE
jgi:hypothetical protein